MKNYNKHDEMYCFIVLLPIIQLTQLVDD